MQNDSVKRLKPHGDYNAGCVAWFAAREALTLLEAISVPYVI